MGWNIVYRDPAYSTSFAGDEDPLSEGNVWQQNNAFFTKVRTTGGNAFGKFPNPQNAGVYEDSYARLSGFSANQYASAIIHKTGSAAGFDEVELHLRCSDTANSTLSYEVFVHQGGAYISCNKWKGTALSAPADIGYFTQIANQNIINAPNDGDLFEAWCIGSLLYARLAGAMYFNGVDLTVGGTVALIASGNPGIGFDGGVGDGSNVNYGFKSFTARNL